MSKEGTSHQHKDTREEGAHKLINARLTLYVSCMYNGERLMLALSLLSLGQERKKERKRESSTYIECFLEAKRKKEAKARKEKQEEGGEALPEQPFPCTIRVFLQVFPWV